MKKIMQNKMLVQLRTHAACYARNGLGLLSFVEDMPRMLRSACLIHWQLDVAKSRLALAVKSRENLTQISMPCRRLIKNQLILSEGLILTITLATKEDEVFYDEYYGCANIFRS